MGKHLPKPVHDAINFQAVHRTEHLCPGLPVFFSSEEQGGIFRGGEPEDLELR